MLNIEFNGVNTPFLSVYDKYYKKIYNFILRQINNEENTKDLTSQTFFKAIKFLKSKNKPKINSAWLYTVASNEIKMFFRRQKKIKFIPFDESQEIKNNYADENDGLKYLKLERLKQLLTNLKQDEKIMIQLHFFEDMSYRDMGKMLKKSEGALRVRMHRILKGLKEMF